MRFLFSLLIIFTCRYEDAFNRFVDEINSLASYNWWEGSVYSIFSVFAYPLAWSWQQLCQKKKMQRLREFVRSEYDHACLRSCRSRALYEGLKVPLINSSWWNHIFQILICFSVWILVAIVRCEPWVAVCLLLYELVRVCMIILDREFVVCFLSYNLKKTSIRRVCFSWCPKQIKNANPNNSDKWYASGLISIFQFH